MKRLFVALKIIPSQKLFDTYQGIRNSLSEAQISWVRPENFHLTLKFLGDTPDKEAGTIENILKDCCSAIHSFSFDIAGAGYFGNLRFPRVIWLGIEGGEALDNAFLRVNDALQHYSKPEDQRTFNPHLTLGRIRQCRNTDALLHMEAQWAEQHIQSQQADRIHLVESFLNPSGPVYKTLASFPLQLH